MRTNRAFLAIGLVLAWASASWAGTLSISRVATGDTITASSINDPYAAIEAIINGGIENVNISAAAAIVESKIAHNSGGHSHGGGTDGAEVTGVALRGYVNGLGISNNSGDANKDIDIAAGRATDSTESVNIALAATQIIQIDVQGANGMDDGDDVGGDAEANTWYDVLVIQTSSGSTQAGFFNKTGTSMDCPSGYTGCTFRVIGHVQTDGSKDILVFIQTGATNRRDYQLVPVQELTDGNDTSYTAIDLASSVPPTAEGVTGSAGCDGDAGHCHIDFSSDGTNQSLIHEMEESATHTLLSHFALLIAPGETVPNIYYKKGANADASIIEVQINGYWEDI